MNIAENIVEGDGWFLDFRVFYTDNTFEDDLIGHHIHSTSPLYPLFLAGIFLLNQSLSAAIFGNVVLAGLLVVAAYLFSEKLFGQTVALTSSIVLMLNPTMYFLSAYVWSEPLFCTLLIASFYFALFPTNNYSFALSGVFAGLVYLARYNGALFIATIVLAFIIRKKYIPTLIFLTASFLTALPWFIRNYLLFENPLFYSTSSAMYMAGGWAQNYPGLPETLQYPLVDFFKYSALSFLNKLSATASVESLFILFPFAIIGCILYLKNKNVQPLILFSALFFAVMCIGPATSYWHSRYLFPIAIFLIPIGVAAFIESIKALFADGLTLFGRVFDYRSVVVVLLASLFLVYGIQDANHAYSNVTTIHLTEEGEAYAWLINHTSPENKLAGTYVPDDYYFTGLESTLIPDLEGQDMGNFIERYNISYFVILLKTGFGPDAYSSEILKELYGAAEVVNAGTKDLCRVYLSNSTIIYEVM